MTPTKKFFIYGWIVRSLIGLIASYMIKQYRRRLIQKQIQALQEVMEARYTAAGVEVLEGIANGFDEGGHHEQ